jgi:SHS2 domain-containing protein
MGYRILDHTADIAVEIHGTTLADLFTQAAVALVDLLTDRNDLTAETTRKIHVEGADLEDLWVNYLREVLYLFNGENFLIKEIMTENGHIPAIIVTESADKQEGPRLDARFSGEIYKPRYHVIRTEIKAVTYHKAEVKRTPAGWLGVFIVDV